MIELIRKIYLIGYIVSNLFAVALLIIAWKRPIMARLIFSIIFLGACATNWTIAVNRPEAYLDFGDMTIFSWYREFIAGWFSEHILLTVGLIASVQGIIGISLLLNGWIYKISVVGGILFLLAIIPLVITSAFPGSIIMTIAMMMIFNKGHNLILEHSRFKKNSIS
ncbi:MAG: hypothetical protein ABIN89_01810 [Chitinophagaceae bacterium]